MLRWRILILKLEKLHLRWKCLIGTFDTPPSSLMDSLQVQRWSQQKEKATGTLRNSQHFGGKRACWSSKMGTKNINKQLNYSHKLAQTKQQVSLCIAIALLVHGQAMGKHGLTRLNTTQIWGKPPPSPL